MLSTELRINGILIANFVIVNTKTKVDGLTIYDVDAYIAPHNGNHGYASKFSIVHDSDDGALFLAYIALAKIVKHEKSKNGK